MLQNVVIVFIFSCTVLYVQFMGPELQDLANLTYVYNTLLTKHQQLIVSSRLQDRFHYSNSPLVLTGLRRSGALTE
jgi:hypothetical protein